MTLSAAIPVHDWQFWAVTALALGAVLWMLRSVVPLPRALRRGRGRTRVTLTIGGQRADERTPGASPAPPGQADASHRDGIRPPPTGSPRT